jgi:hypothetical protein
MKYIIAAILALSSLAAHADVTMSWIIGAPVVGSEVVGFNIKYGSESGLYSNTEIVTDAVATSHVFAVPDGVNYFAMTAFDALGRESVISSEVACTVIEGACVGPNGLGGTTVQ